MLLASFEAKDQDTFNLAQQTESYLILLFNIYLNFYANPNRHFEKSSLLLCETKTKGDVRTAWLHSAKTTQRVRSSEKGRA